MIKPKVILIAGPTGVGKTAVSIELARMLRTEIISCDSMQIYKGMDIGTAKVTPTEAGGIVHHMTDIISPDIPFSVREYVSLASQAADDMISRGMIPLIVGGTGLYADSLIKGIAFGDGAGADEGLRAELLSMANERGNDYVHSLLRQADPESADAIHSNNIKRVIRALEYYHTTGTKISDYNASTKLISPPYDSVRFYLARERQSLYKRIDERVDKMLEDGLADEVRALIDKGIDTNSTAMQAIGYKEMLSYLDGSISLCEASELIKKGTRHYAKRQLTWFRRDKEGIWIDLDLTDSPLEAAQICYGKLKERNFV